MTGLQTWPASAEKLKVDVRHPADHAHRWRESLRDSYQSAFSRSLLEGIDGKLLLEHCLDAAAGIAFEVERLQRSCLGDAWDTRTAAYRRISDTLALPLHPPAGAAPDVWAAVRKIHACRAADTDAVQARLPAEFALLHDLEERAPADYKRLMAAASTAGLRIDDGPRRAAVDQAFDLNTAQAFRTVWEQVFGNLRTRPKAPLQIAAELLALVLEDVRPRALFLEHCGLTTRRFAEKEDGPSPKLLRVIDDEVHAASRAWAGLRPQLGERGNALRLASTVEGLTHDDLIVSPSWRPSALATG